MNKENTDKLFNDFNSFFNWGEPIKENLVSGFGFECGDGWFKLIYKLCKDLKKIVDKKNIDIKVCQVKEKFAGLRFYINCGTNKIYKRIRKAENKSYKVCEECGKKGKLRKLNWWITLCNKCLKNKNL